MSEFAIDIQDISKVFDDKTVVNKVSLQVKKGAVFGFLGSNGSGKTTMIRMMCGLLTPTMGTGKCLGYDIQTESAAIKANIGYMPQRFSLYHELTVNETLQFFADIYQIQEPKESIAEVTLSLELTPYAHIKAGNLSGGWKQRLTLACCILHKPALLFLDEPTAGIDPKARKDFWNYLHHIAIRDGTTILVTTHYMDEAEKCTDLAYIYLGNLLYSGTTRDLVPFSNVRTYRIEASRASLDQLNEMCAHQYPAILVSLVNNDVRISSADNVKLSQFMQENTAYVFEAVSPSFEEVFIGLMQSC